MIVYSLWRPRRALERIGEAAPRPRAALLRLLPLALAPPLAAYVGGVNFGWRLGGAEPLRMESDQMALVSLGYFVALLGGFVGTAAVARWMAPTYAASRDFGSHLALVAIVAAPLSAGGLAHLFPHVFLNLLVLIPALLWSLYLLYTGLPVALGVSPERGMLMASSLVGALLVAAVTLLGVSVALWAAGVGPTIGV